MDLEPDSNHHRTAQRRLWQLALLTVVAVVALSCGGDDSSPSDASAEPETSNEPVVDESDDQPPAEPEVEFGLSWTSIDFVDSSRSTEEISRNGEVLLVASDTRTIPTPILYPGVGEGGEDSDVAATDPRPLAIWLNGLAGSAAAGDPLLLDLFDAGFVVIAPNIPEIAAPAADLDGFIFQAPDVSFIIDSLADTNDGQGDDLAASIDFDHIAVIGHSTGATGAFGLVGHSCCADDRVDVAVGFGSNLLRTYDDTGFDFDDTPLLLIRGDADEIGPLADAETLLGQGGSNSYLLTVPDADHFAPVYGADDNTTAQEFASAAVIAFLATHLTGTASDADLETFATGLPEGSWRTS